ncbi:MAG: DUF4013 domain-containing protein [Phototrophicaceae bacterium]
MNFGKSFTYLLHDDDGLIKIGINLVVTLVGGVMLIFFGLGIILFAAQQGYKIQLIKNMLEGEEKPLPAWDQWGKKITQGFHIILANIVYSIIPSLILCGALVPAVMASLPLFDIMEVDPETEEIYFTDQDRADAIFAQIGTAALPFFCLTPFVIFYGLVTSALMNLATVRYAQSGQVGEFFKVGSLWGGVSKNMNLTIQWWLYSVGVGIILGIANWILSATVVGGVLVTAVQMPIMGHLIGQYGVLVNEKNQSSDPLYTPRFEV